MQDCSISSALALEILQSCTKASRWSSYIAIATGSLILTVNEAWISNYICSFMCGVITNPCPNFKRMFISTVEVREWMCVLSPIHAMYEPRNVRALKSSLLNKIHIFQCMDKIFWRNLKFHTKYLTHTLKDTLFIPCWNFNSLRPSDAYMRQ